MFYNNKTTMTQTLTNYVYVKFLKTRKDNFNKMMNMFLVLKNKNFEFEHKFFGDEHNLTSLKQKLFNGIDLEVGAVYVIGVRETGTFNSYTYIKSLHIQTVPDTKAQKLLALQQQSIPEAKITVSKYVDSDEEIEEEEHKPTKPKTKPKKNKHKKRMVDSDSD